MKECPECKIIELERRFNKLEDSLLHEGITKCEDWEQGKWSPCKHGRMDVNKIRA